MAKAGLEHEIELAVLERQIDDRPKLVELFQLFRSLRVNGAVVLDAPGIDPAQTQRADEFAAGRSRDQEPVTLRPVPDDLDQVHQKSGIGEVVPDFTIGSKPAIVLEIVAIDL